MGLKRSSKLLSKITKFCKEKKLFERTGTLVIGVSGGIDSMVLLHVLQKIKHTFNFQIVVAHLNHGIRGEEAKSDAEFVQSYCAGVGIPCFIKSVDIISLAQSQKESIEAVGREVRYKFLEEIRSQYENAKIATAHHAEDNAETVLFNLLRGTGLAGSSGILLNSQTLCRPLLSTRKSEIINYANFEKVEFREDSTNTDTNYTRNYIRLSLLPQIEEHINPNVVETLNNFASISGAYNEYFKELTLQVQGVTDEEYDNMIELNLEKVKKLPRAVLVDYLRFRVLEKFSVNLTFNSIKKLVELLETPILGEIYSDSCLIIEKERNSLLLHSSDTEQHIVENITVPLPGKVTLAGSTILFEEVQSGDLTLNTDRNVEYFAVDSSVVNVLVRAWQPGDWFKPIGGKGKKKVSDFLTDAKVKHRDRKKVLVVTEGESIMWLVGFRMDKRFSVTSKTNRIVKATLIYE